MAACERERVARAAAGQSGPDSHDGEGAS